MLYEPLTHSIAQAGQTEKIVESGNKEPWTCHQLGQRYASIATGFPNMLQRLESTMQGGSFWPQAEHRTARTHTDTDMQHDQNIGKSHLNGNG